MSKINVRHPKYVSIGENIRIKENDFIDTVNGKLDRGEYVLDSFGSKTVEIDGETYTIEKLNYSIEVFGTSYLFEGYGSEDAIHTFKDSDKCIISIPFNVQNIFYKRGGKWLFFNIREIDQYDNIIKPRLNPFYYRGELININK